MTVDARWDSWHLHVPAFGPAATDQVVTRVVAPAADLLAAWASPTVWFFVRYWQFGPHVRFRVVGLDQEQSDQVDALLRAQLSETLAGITPALSPEEYRRVAAPLAAAGEGGQALELGDLRAPGVYREPYRPEIERYGGPGRLDRSEALFATSSELALAFLRRNPPDAARSGLGLCATRAALDALADGDHRRRFCRRASDGWQAGASRGGGGGDNAEVVALASLPLGSGGVVGGADPGAGAALGRPIRGGDGDLAGGRAVRTWRNASFTPMSTCSTTGWA